MVGRNSAMNCGRKLTVENFDCSQTSVVPKFQNAPGQEVQLSNSVNC
jgi:hypothetical protein